jgi:hypothetical protein
MYILAVRAGRRRSLRPAQVSPKRDKPDFDIHRKMVRRDPLKLAKPCARVAAQRLNWPSALSATMSTADELFANNR